MGASCCMLADGTALFGERPGHLFLTRRLAHATLDYSISSPVFLYAQKPSTLQEVVVERFAGYVRRYSTCLSQVRAGLGVGSAWLRLRARSTIAAFIQASPLLRTSASCETLVASHLKCGTFDLKLRTCGSYLFPSQAGYPIHTFKLRKNGLK